MLNFIEDLEYILASFKQCYGLSVEQVYQLPFNIFLMYLNGLSEDTSLIKIINLRNMPYAEIKDPKLLELKNKYELKSTSSQKEQEQQQNIQNAFMFLANSKNKEKKNE